MTIAPRGRQRSAYRAQSSAARQQCCHTPHTRPAQERPSAFRVAKALVLTPPGDDLGPLLKRTRFGLGPIRGKRGIVGGV